MQVTLDEIEAATHRALIAHGAEPTPAAAVAHAVRRAEAVGNVICGLYYLESYCLQLVSGRVKGDAKPVISQPRPASVLANASYGFAQPAFAEALPVAVAAAQSQGIAMLAVRHAHTCTSLGYFTEQIAAHGLIGLGFTNASPIVAPPGGTKAAIGTNPIALSVPGSQAGDPLRLHFDFSTSAVALGKITMAKAAGEPIPEGWAIDAEGNPTTDPEAALGGSLVSAGGYKGWGFGLLAELLAAGIAGGVNSLDVKALKAPEGAPHDLGQCYLLLDPSTFGDHFDERFARLAEAVNEQPDARLPGAVREGKTLVEVPDALWNRVIELASVAA